MTNDDFDRRVRGLVYEATLSRGYPPLIAEVANHLDIPPEEIRQAFKRLAAARVIVLQRDNDEILMANPFSAVPTPFLVQTEPYSCYGNCIWDAMGIAAMLHQDATIKTSCGDCGTAMDVNIRDGQVQVDQGILHFAVPALHWWDNIVFT